MDTALQQLIYSPNESLRQLALLQAEAQGISLEPLLHPCRVLADAMGIGHHPLEAQLSILLDNDKWLIRGKGHQFKALPDAMHWFAHLTQLKVSSCALNHLPDSFAALHHLEGLYLDGNHFETIPAVVGQLTRLEILVMASNQLVTLPEHLRTCTALTTLDVSANQLQALPAWLAELPDLRTIKAHDNQLRAEDLPDALLQRIRAHQLTVYL